MKKSLLTAISLLLPFLLMSQPAFKALPELGFASLDKNHIIFEGDSSAFDSFFAKLDSVCLMGEGRVNILHLGGSHVQGGTMTRQIRNDLLSMGRDFGQTGTPDAGPGFLFPFSAAKTNNPSGFKTRTEGIWKASKCVQREPSAVLGLSGMAISTSDPGASVKIVMVPRQPADDDVPAPFDRMTVLGYSSSGDLAPIVVGECGDTLSGTAGDSCWVFRFTQPQDSVRIALSGTSGDFTLTGIFLDKASSHGISVSGVGVNGAGLLSYSRCTDFERDLGLVKPDLAILAIGINDAVSTSFSEEVFKERYKALIARLRFVNPDCALLFVTNNDSYRRSRKKGYYVNQNGPRARQAFLELGRECGGGVWDQFEIMGGLESMKKWESAGLARKDKVHFTDDGYCLLGDLLYNALMEKYVEHLNRNGR
ncbi:MAG: GDSL-type esterase/lipase family protein [Candidatus Cryptobacteroides sp.]